MLPVRTIVYPTDYSRLSEYAFQLACALARDYRALLIVMHVKPPPVLMAELPALPPQSESNETMKQELARYQPDDASIRVEHYLLEGDPASEIVRLAMGHQADLIVMGTHGRTGLSRLLVGSVAEVVLRKAPCPVLTIKMPPLEGEPIRPQSGIRVSPA